MRYKAESEDEDEEHFFGDVDDYNSFKFAIDFNKNKLVNSKRKRLLTFLNFY